MRTLQAGVCALAGMLLLAGSAQAGAGGESCHRIDATGVGQDLGSGHTTARIIDGGLLNGTTAGTFTIGGAPPVLAIHGSVVFATNQATLTVDVSGTFDVSTGAFNASGSVTAATGKLEGATGSLTLSGVENLATGQFTETVTGSICVNLSP